jgi:hypothetical protein
MKTFKSILILISACFICGTSFAEESNRSDVMKNVEKGWNKTAWGVVVNDAEYLKFTAAVAKAIATENPAPVMRYFEDMVRRNISKFKKEAGGIAEEVLWEAIVDGMKNGKISKFDRLELKAGLATWQRWQIVSYHEPRTYKCKQSLPFGGWTWGVCTTTELVRKRVSLPNWHQPFVSIRYR